MYYSLWWSDKKKPDSPNFSQKCQIKNITLWGWILALLLISLNIGTIYSSKENAKSEIKTNTIRHSSIIDKLNVQISNDSIRILKDSIRISKLNSELIGLENYIHEQQFDRDKIQKTNLNFLFKQLREENYVITYKSYSPNFYQNAVGLLPFNTFFRAIYGLL